MRSGLKFLADLPRYDSEKPYFLVGFPDLPEEASTNCVFDTEVDIHLSDVRTLDEKPTLGAYGFEYFSHKSRLSLDTGAYIGDSYCQDTVDGYLSETLDLVQSRFPTSNIIVFDWRVRSLQRVKHIGGPAKIETRSARVAS